MAGISGHFNFYGNSRGLKGGLTGGSKKPMELAPPPEPKLTKEGLRLDPKDLPLNEADHNEPPIRGFIMPTPPKGPGKPKEFLG